MWSNKKCSQAFFLREKPLGQTVLFLSLKLKSNTTTSKQNHLSLKLKSENNSSWSSLVHFSGSKRCFSRELSHPWPPLDLFSSVTDYYYRVKRLSPSSSVAKTGPWPFSSGSIIMSLGDLYGSSRGQISFPFVFCNSCFLQRRGFFNLLYALLAQIWGLESRDLRWIMILKGPFLILDTVR